MGKGRKVQREWGKRSSLDKKSREPSLMMALESRVLSFQVKKSGEQSQQANLMASF